jgi:hypothetical protein
MEVFGFVYVISTRKWRINTLISGIFGKQKTGRKDNISGGRTIIPSGFRLQALRPRFSVGFAFFKVSRTTQKGLPKNIRGRPNRKTSLKRKSRSPLLSRVCRCSE